MRTAHQHLQDIYWLLVDGPQSDATVMQEARDRDIRAEAFAESLMILRGLAADHMTPGLEQSLAMLEKAIARRTTGQ